MPEDTKIPKWEYRRVDAFSDELNELGKKGWEVCGLAGVSSGTAILKRQAGWIRVTEHVHEPEVNNENQQDNGYLR